MLHIAVHAPDADFAGINSFFAAVIVTDDQRAIIGNRQGQTVTDSVASTSALLLTMVTQVAKVLPVPALMRMAMVNVAVTIVVKKVRTAVLHPVSARATTTPMRSTAPRSAWSIRRNTLTPMRPSA